MVGDERGGIRAERMVGNARVGRGGEGRGGEGRGGEEVRG